MMQKQQRKPRSPARTIQHYTGNKSNKKPMSKAFIRRNAFAMKWFLFKRNFAGPDTQGENMNDYEGRLQGTLFKDETW